MKKQAGLSRVEERKAVLTRSNASPSRTPQILVVTGGRCTRPTVRAGVQVPFRGTNTS
jgi:hypothetical protein